MKPILGIFLLIALMATFSDVSGQNSSRPSKIHWEDVEIRTLEKDSPDSDIGTGEWSIQTEKKVQEIEDLSEREVKRIKKMVARDGGDLVFLDTKKINGDDGSLYFYWVNSKYLKNVAQQLLSK